jgi:hypothetical protein
MNRVLNILKQIIHFLAGVLTAYTSFYNIALSILMFIVFVIYELDEDWHIRDQAYKDILVYALGLYMYAFVHTLAKP